MWSVGSHFNHLVEVIRSTPCLCPHHCSPEVRTRACYGHSPSLHLGVTEFQYSHRKRLGNPSSASALRSVPCKILQIPTAMVWLRMAPISSSFECLVTREWHYLKGLGEGASLEEVYHWRQQFACQAQSLSLPVACRSDAETPATSPAPSPHAAMLITTLTTEASTS